MSGGMKYPKFVFSTLLKWKQEESAVIVDEWTIYDRNDMLVVEENDGVKPHWAHQLPLDDCSISALTECLSEGISVSSVFFITSLSWLLLCRTTEQQQRFHEICGNLVKTQRRVVGWWKRLCALKEEKPKMVKLKCLHTYTKKPVSESFSLHSKDVNPAGQTASTSMLQY